MSQAHKPAFLTRDAKVFSIPYDWIGEVDARVSVTDYGVRFRNREGQWTAPIQWRVIYEMAALKSGGPQPIVRAMERK